MIDFVDEVEEDDVERIEPVGHQRTSVPFPSAPPVGYASWGDWFREKKAESTKEAAVPAAVTTVTASDDNPDRSGLGVNLKKLIRMAEAADWDYFVRRTATWTTDAFYADDSQKKPGEEQPKNRRGDLKKAAHETIHWWINGRIVSMRLGFVCHWTEGLTPSGGRSFGFEGAHVVEPVGMPTELYFDYEHLDKRQLETLYPSEGERARRLAAAGRQNHDYNDGSDYINRRPSFGAWRDFALWLEDWAAIIEQSKEKQAA
jgi:hypothetical protein